MTWVKVCGIRDDVALHAAASSGADAIGLVLAPSSPRVVSLERAATLAAATDIDSFLVTVDASPAAVLAALERTGASGVQPHGSRGQEVADAVLRHGGSVLFPIPVGAGGPSIDPGDLPAGVIPLFDTRSRALHGGSGTTFDWGLVADVEGPWILAGGLGVDNVAEAIRTVRPFGVDASSRLESEPGVKDPDTIRAFIREAKGA